VRGLVMLAMATSLSGCTAPLIPIEYVPDATVRSASIPEKEADRTLVSIGPRRFLDHLTKRIAKENARLAAVDRLAVRDAMFPQGDWRLSALLAAAPSDDVRDQVDYLVLVNGRAIWAASNAIIAHSDLSAFVLDVSAHAFATGYRARSDASYLRIFFDIDAHQAVTLEIAHAVADYMLRAHTEGTVRFVVMAAEMPSETAR